MRSTSGPRAPCRRASRGVERRRAASPPPHRPQPLGGKSSGAGADAGVLLRTIVCASMPRRGGSNGWPPSTGRVGFPRRVLAFRRSIFVHALTCSSIPGVTDPPNGKRPARMSRTRRPCPCAVASHTARRPGSPGTGRAAPHRLLAARTSAASSVVSPACATTRMGSASRGKAGHAAGLSRGRHAVQEIAQALQSPRRPPRVRHAGGVRYPASVSIKSRTMRVRGLVVGKFAGEHAHAWGKFPRCPSPANASWTSASQAASTNRGGSVSTCRSGMRKRKPIATNAGCQSNP